MAKIVNLTPHDLHMHDGIGKIVTIPRSGMIARVGVNTARIGQVAVGEISVPINRNFYADIEGLPDPQPDTLFVVSAMVAQAAKGRDDLLIVDDTVRDSDGRIIGAKAFGKI